MSQLHQAFLPQHTAGAHRVFAVVDRGHGEALEALASFPTAERADAIADLLNLLVTGRPNKTVTERLVALLEAEPSPVRAAVLEVAAAFGNGNHVLATHLRRRLTAAFMSFPTGCPTAGCGRCTDCAQGCESCSICEEGGCKECYQPAVSPRTALLLNAAADILSDELTVMFDEEELADLPPMFSQLPPEALYKFADAYLALGSDLAEGREPHPRTTAEEIALHLMTERAETILEEGAFDDLLAKLPSARNDYDWDRILDLLYQDSDYVDLMDRSVEFSAKEVTQMFELFDNMGPRVRGED